MLIFDTTHPASIKYGSKIHPDIYFSYQNAIASSRVIVPK